MGVSRTDAGAHPEGSSHSGQDGDDDVDDFLPKFLFVHGVFELCVVSYEFFTTEGTEFHGVS